MAPLSNGLAPVWSPHCTPIFVVLDVTNGDIGTRSNMPNILGRRALRSGRRAPGLMQRITLPGDLREQLRVDERIRDAVGRQRILEVTGITDECPAGSERLSKESFLSRKPAVFFNPFRLFHHRRQVGPAFPQDLPVSRVAPSLIVSWNRCCGTETNIQVSPSLVDSTGAHTRVVIPVVTVEPRA